MFDSRLAHQEAHTTVTDNALCHMRTEDKPHCWHAFMPPMNNQGISVSIPSLCCWCTPEYYHLEVFVSATMPLEDVAAANYEHGRLVVIRNMPNRGPKLHVAR